MVKEEQLLYDIINEIANSGAPIIFKGGLVTKLILFENKFYEIERQTVDIDASWVNPLQTIQEM